MESLTHFRLEDILVRKEVKVVADIKKTIDVLLNMMPENEEEGEALSVAILILRDKLRSSDSKNGCECCSGDEALYYKDGEHCAFVDSTGEIMVTVQNRIMRFKVNCCPNCGKKF